MSFSLTKFIKGLRISKEDSTNPSNIDIIPGGTAGTTTTLVGSQTANQTVTLPNETGTVLTTASTIDLDQLEALAIQKAVATNGTGHLVAVTTTATELDYLAGTTSAVQTQLNTLTTNLSTETTNRTNADTLKANLTLNNILPVASVDVNGQKVVNAGTPTSAADLTTKAYVDAAVTGGGANLTLSNLTSPTAINQHILPGANNTYNIGASGNVFANSRATNVFTNQIATISGSGVLQTSAFQLYGNGTLKIDFSGTDVSFNTRKLTNIVNPTSAQDAATKSYVDTATAALPNINKTNTAFQSGSNYTIDLTSKIVQYGTVLRNDMTSAWNTTTNEFTAPYTGKYSVNASMLATGTLGTSDYVAMTANLGPTYTSAYESVIFGGGANVSYSPAIIKIIELTAGQALRFEVTSFPNLTLFQSFKQQVSITFLGA